MNMADAQNERSKTPKTEYATFATRARTQNVSETIRDFEIMSVYSKE